MLQLPLIYSGISKKEDERAQLVLQKSKTGNIRTQPRQFIEWWSSQRVVIARVSINDPATF
jgi:ABC-type lipoprotein export system ATPase subunit